VVPFPVFYPLSLVLLPPLHEINLGGSWGLGAVGVAAFILFSFQCKLEKMVSYLLAVVEGEKKEFSFHLFGMYISGRGSTMAIYSVSHMFYIYWLRGVVRPAQDLPRMGGSHCILEECSSCKAGPKRPPEKFLTFPGLFSIPSILRCQPSLLHMSQHCSLRLGSNYFCRQHVDGLS